MGRMIDRRRVMGGSLPYDAEIEYLESQGNCFIPTNVIPTGTNIIIKTKIYPIGYTTSAEWIEWFSACTNVQSECYRIVRFRSSNNEVWVHNSGRGGVDGTRVSIALKTLYDIEIYPRYGLINGRRFSLPSSATLVNTSIMTIFSTQFKGRFYSFYMSDGDNVLLDLIPVRVGNVGYMYDKVSKQLFGNSGTGAFILGPDK